MPPFRWFRLFERLGILLRKLAKDEFQATFLGSGGPRTDLNILEKQLTDCKDSRLELVCTGRRGSYTEPLANRGDDIIDKIAAVDAGATASARRLEYTDRTELLDPGLEGVGYVHATLRVHRYATGSLELAIAASGTA